MQAESMGYQTKAQKTGRLVKVTDLMSKDILSRHVGEAIKELSEELGIGTIDVDFSADSRRELAAMMLIFLRRRSDIDKRRISVDFKHY